MALELEWSPEAEEQLDEIIEYLEKHWTDREIKNFFTRLEQAIKEITEAPERYKKSDRREGAREFQLSPQTTLFYSHNQEKVSIPSLMGKPERPGRYKAISPTCPRLQRL